MPTTLDNTEPLTHPLDRLRGLIRSYVIRDGLLTAGLFAILWYWFGLAFDWGLFKLTNFDWVLDAPKFLRILAFAVLAALLASLLFTRLYQRLSREVSYPSLALLLEKRFPKILGDKLITAVELSDLKKAASHGYSVEMLRATIDDAREAVGQVPVETVFNWRRLRIKAVLLVLFAVGTLVAVFAGYCAATGSVEPKRFAQEFGDTSLIWADRNLLLGNMPWPRKAHLELLDFPGEEKRVGRDAPPPKISVRAYKWVVVDKSNLHGWRPLIWHEASKLVRDLPVLATITQANGRPFPDDAADWDVDRIEAAAGENLRPFFDALTEEAAQPSNSLRFRKLEIPESVILTYSGSQSYGKVTLTREANNVFVGEVTGLKESVRFTVRGSDFTTRPRSITLVPPPMLSRLARHEYQPAYLHHPPPIGLDQNSLRGLRQSMGERELSLTGDKTVITIIKGTEFELRGTSDKRLSKIVLKPRTGPLPGMLGLVPIDLLGVRGYAPAIVKAAPEYEPEGDNHDSFTLSFRGVDAPTANLEFDIIIIDDEKVATPRTILVQVVDDQAPSVELAVDTLRKIGNDYLVTPAAMVPFQAESKVRDDLALGSVDFVFSASQIESGIAQSLQGQALGTMFAFVPLLPTTPDLYLTWASATFAQSTMKAEKRETGRVSVPRFASHYNGLKRDAFDVLKTKLQNPLDPDATLAIREVKLGGSDAVFDFRIAMPKLAGSFESGDISTRYRVDLALRATDANVDSGPKISENLEPIRLLVVSEADLLAEMSKDEESQAVKLDEILKKLKDAQTKLTVTSDRLIPLSPPPDVIVSSAVRMNDIAQDFAKSREISTGVQGEYRKLRREGLMNRIGFAAGVETDSQYLKRIDTEILKPLDEILEKGFAELEQAHQVLQTQLGENRRPDDNVVAADRFALSKLIAEIENLRRKLGEAVTLNKLRTDLMELHARQVAAGKILKLIKEYEVSKLYQPELAQMPPIELAKGETKTILHKLDWKVYSGSLSVKFTGPGADKVKTPEIVKVADERFDFDYTLTAGQTPGEYKITLTPTVGAAVVITVKVK